MDRLTAMTVFVRVAEAGSFSKAALQLGMSNSAVTSRVKALEDHLGARLLERTTRRVRLTETGRAYLERCSHLLSELEETELSVRNLHSRPRGKLRVNAPISFGVLHVATAIPDFLTRYPDIHVELSLTDRFVDVVEEASPGRAEVETYSKTGTWGPIFADAGIVRHRSGHQLVMVVFIEGRPAYRGSFIAELTRRAVDRLLRGRS